MERQRRKRVVERLQSQLEASTKPCKESGANIPLTNHDINRIQKEIAILDTKLKL